ncbi:MAG TPA: 23S rRNA (adenine(2503)-C(2))-methyltransferase RlmN [Acidobacteriota bacterium]|nr:23S rRNA (adenine(2503)-C(2))-methyltransferase RlmN [Acidobacteriota bacterium]
MTSVVSRDETRSQTARPSLIGLDRTELATTLATYGEPAFRAKQVFRALYKRMAGSIEDIHELPKSLREKLSPHFTIDTVTLAQTFNSSDGTRRYLFNVNGNEAIEAVWIPEARRSTICLSSQAGCPLACDFCLTAQIGLKRNLTVGEIVGQVVYVLRSELERLRREHPTQEVKLPPINLVFMGMGEPFLNYANVMQAIRLMGDADGLEIRPSHVTVSTAGIVPRIVDFGKEPNRPRLAISLSAPTDELRNQLMPINRRYPLADLMQACETFPLAPGEKMTFEYVMLDGINDHDEHAHQILKLTTRLRARNAVKLNLIPHNPAPELPYQPSTEARVLAFQSILKQKDLPVFIRRPRGRDITAACGQLAATHESQRVIYKF